MSDALPILPHVTGEFYAWLWWKSDTERARFDLGEDVGTIDLWVDERLAFRNPNDTKVTAVMTGENPSDTLEARAAMQGGKVLQEIRLGIKRDDREFFVTLKGPEMHLSGLKLPQVLAETEEEAVYDRMFSYEEITFLVANLFNQFAQVRTRPEWDHQVVPAIRAWVAGLES